MHQLTLLLTSRRRESEVEASVSAEGSEPEKPGVAPAVKESPVRCLNESAHKLYR